MKFTIKRSEWLRGEGGDNSYLLRGSDGKMCCLGQLAVALGAEKTSIHNKDTPARAPSIEWPTGFISPTPSGNWRNHACISLMQINDEPYLSDAVREATLIDSFKYLGIEVEFVD